MKWTRAHRADKIQQEIKTTRNQLVLSQSSTQWDQKLYNNKLNSSLSALCAVSQFMYIENAQENTPWGVAKINLLMCCIWKPKVLLSARLIILINTVFTPSAVLWLQMLLWNYIPGLQDLSPPLNLYFIISTASKCLRWNQIQLLDETWKKMQYYHISSSEGPRQVLLDSQLNMSQFWCT